MGRTIPQRNATQRVTIMTKTADLQVIGKAAYDSIACMVEALECDYDRLEELRDRAASEDPDDALECDEQDELDELEDQANGCDDEDDAVRAIEEDPLSIQVRGGWHCPGDGNDCPDEYEILLSTGGPASRIRGELDNYGQPVSAVLSVQDWFTPWTDYNGCDEDVLLTYASRHWFGEGC